MAVAEEQHVDIDVVEYMKQNPTHDELAAIAAKLEDPVADMVRKDSQFKKLELDADDYVDADTVVELLVRYPRLIQRPILVREDKAIVGRPKDRIAPFLNGE
ncbi:MAG TPA: ArsC/Spx/MgsR family protein [Acidimicrobiales bacterium]|nr:ArsC/Spx/MgsR family protein [Acidimicrobiales bacterium]